MNRPRTRSRQRLGLSGNLPYYIQNPNVLTSASQPTAIDRPPRARPRCSRNDDGGSLRPHHEPRFGPVTTRQSLPTLERARAALTARGVDIFRVEAAEIALAKRVRSHLMDAGVSVCFAPEPNVRFIVRAQSSDFPGVSAKQLYDKVREEVAAQARAHGFEEIAERPREVRDPGDASRVLDIWYELTFAKPVRDAESWLDDIRWAMSVSKCVGY